VQAAVVPVLEFVGQIIDAVERKTGGDRSVCVHERRLQARVVRRQRRERREVTAGGIAGNDDEARIASLLGCMLADPRDRALDVDDVVGEGRARAQPIVDAEADPAERREVLQHRQPLKRFAAHHPRSTVDEQECRLWPRLRAVGALAAAINVQPQRDIAVLW